MRAFQSKVTKNNKKIMNKFKFLKNNLFRSHKTKFKFKTKTCSILIERRFREEEKKRLSNNLRQKNKLLSRRLKLDIFN